MLDRVSKYEEIMPDSCLGEVVSKLIEWGFFNAPASRNHHGSYRGGLFDHSYAVTEELLMLTRHNRLKWERSESPYIVGMFHDLCKVDNYIWDSTKNSYSYNNSCLFKGHGDKSIMLLSTLMPLTMEEAACIRYHMGAFTPKEEWEYYSRAVNLYPNVLWTHHSDMIVSQVRGI